DYRKTGTSRIATPLEAAAYAASRMPATFAALSAAFREIDVKIDSVLDLGAGAGAAGWAAKAHFGDSVQVTAVEPNDLLRRLGASFCPNFHWRGGDYRNLSGLPGHDLVVFGYSLGEAVPAVALEVLERSYLLANKALVIVEPGTPSSFGQLLPVRQRLIDLGATIAAPCPHQGPCPLTGGDWCHFAVRTDRSKIHKLLKGGQAGFEDEKFAYMVAMRSPPAAAPPFARILRHPLIEPKSINLKLCEPAGLANLRVRANDKRAAKAARKASWGDRWAAPGTDD
ncbi:MAG: rRNA methyltransferase, partial [Bryobacteraceae bacterium]|nr:rRNA methyltransferase [Bryobacteraceae bacterium]